MAEEEEQKPLDRDKVISIANSGKQFTPQLRVLKNKQDGTFVVEYGNKDPLGLRKVFEADFDNEIKKLKSQRKKATTVTKAEKKVKYEIRK